MKKVEKVKRERKKRREVKTQLEPFYVHFSTIFRCVLPYHVIDEQACIQMLQGLLFFLFILNFEGKATGSRSK